MKPDEHSHKWAQEQATKMFGDLGVAVRRGNMCQVGRFVRNPRCFPPPWPIDVYGESSNWADAIEAARRGGEKLQAGGESKS
jgi:hypothetical protein